MHVKSQFHPSADSEDIGFSRILQSNWSRAYTDVPDHI